VLLEIVGVKVTVLQCFTDLHPWRRASVSLARAPDRAELLKQLERVEFVPVLGEPFRRACARTRDPYANSRRLVSVAIYRRRWARFSSAGGVHPISAVDVYVPGGTISSMRSRSAASSLRSAPGS
jgi:hypothetical protein